MRTATFFRSGHAGCRPPGIALGLLLGAAGLTARAHVSNYTFTTSSGVYAPFSDGNLLISGSFLHDVRALHLPEPFFFDGQYYSTLYVSTNGFITLGTPPSANNTSPINSTAAYAGAIAPFGANLRSIPAGASPRDVRWKMEGDEAIVQWRGLRRNLSNNAENISFQARLNVVDGRIRFVYGGVANLNADATVFPQVGLRGADREANNRTLRSVGTGAQTWQNSAEGATSAATLRFTSSAPARYPSSGLTFTWTPYCVPVHVSSATVMSDCAQGQFYVQVVISDQGAPPSTSITSSVGGTLYGDIDAGSYLCGPFPSTAPVTLSLTHDGPEACGGMIGTFEARPCVTNGACITSPLAIPDNGCADNNALEVEIAVSGQPDLGTGANDIQLRSVDLVLAHTSRSQLRVSLRSPSGQQRTLIDRRAGFGDHFGNPAICPASFFSLADDGDPLSNLTGNGMSNIAGLYAPEQSLAGFTGDPNGVWTLIICDAQAGDQGALGYVKLDFTDVICRKTQLVDDPALPTHSCGLTDVQLDGSQALWAEEVTGASHYRFEFFEPFGGTQIIALSETPALPLLQSAFLPLQNGMMYEVRVRVSLDNGLSYCGAGPACTIITTGEAFLLQRNMEALPSSGEALLLWPVPNNGTSMQLVADGFASDQTVATLDVLTVDGGLVDRQTIPVNEGSIRSSIVPAHRLAAGLYVISVRCGGDHRTQRVTVE